MVGRPGRRARRASTRSRRRLSSGGAWTPSTPWRVLRVSRVPPGAGRPRPPDRRIHELLDPSTDIPVKDLCFLPRRGRGGRSPPCSARLPGHAMRDTLIRMLHTLPRLCPDQRGHGDSEPATVYTRASRRHISGGWPARLTALVSGHVVGGRKPLYCAAKQRETVDKLVRRLVGDQQARGTALSRARRADTWEASSSPKHSTARNHTGHPTTAGSSSPMPGPDGALVGTGTERQAPGSQADIDWWALLKRPWYTELVLAARKARARRDVAERRARDLPPASPSRSRSGSTRARGKPEAARPLKAFSGLSRRYAWEPIAGVLRAGAGGRRGRAGQAPDAPGQEPRRQSGAAGRAFCFFIAVQNCFTPAARWPSRTVIRSYPLINRLAGGFQQSGADQDGTRRTRVPRVEPPGQKPFEPTSLPYGTQGPWRHCVQGTDARTCTRTLSFRHVPHIRKGHRQDMIPTRPSTRRGKTRTGLHGYLRDPALPGLSVGSPPTSGRMVAVDGAQGGLSAAVHRDACRGSTRRVAGKAGQT